MVPRPLKKMEGDGLLEESLVVHWEESEETSGMSFGEVVLGCLREMECTFLIEGRARSVERICEPWCRS